MPILWVLVRYPDGRREPEAFLCTDTGAAPRDVLDCFNRRWAVETTYEEARAHLGMETQRQWSDPAMAFTVRATQVAVLSFYWAGQILPA